MSPIGLPNGWVEAPLSTLARIQYGYTASAIEDQRAPRLLRITDIQDGRVDWAKVPGCSIRSGDLDKYRLRPRDIVFARSGATTGKSLLIQSCPPDALFASYLIRVHADELVTDPKYLALYFQSPPYWAHIAGSVAGIAQPNCNGTKLAALNVPLAPLSEQRRIVAEIEKQFTRLDAGVEALKRLQIHLRRYRASVLKAACEGRLVPTEAALAQKENRDYEPADKLLARILKERRAKWETDQLAKMKAAGNTPKNDNWKAKYIRPTPPDISAPVDLSDGWGWVSVEQVAADEANSITDGPFGSNLKTQHYVETGPRVVRLQNIGDGKFIDEEAHISRAHFTGLQKHRVFPGDVVIAALGERPPRACLIPESLGDAIVKADCIRFKPDPVCALAGFMSIVLNSETTRHRIADRVHGVGRPRLNLGEIRSIGIPLPPPREQRRIIAEVEDRLSIAEAAEAALMVNLARASRLRQALLRRAFEGKLVSQDPKDEPASVLLDRIQAQRQAESEDAGPTKKRGAKKANAKAATAA